MAENEVCKDGEGTVSDRAGGGIAVCSASEFYDEITWLLHGSSYTMLELWILLMILLESLLEFLLYLLVMITTEICHIYRPVRAGN